MSLLSNIPQNIYVDSVNYCDNGLARSIKYSLFVASLCIANIIAQNKLFVVMTVLVILGLIVIDFLSKPHFYILGIFVIYSPFSLRIHLSSSFALSSDLLLFDFFVLLLLLKLLVSGKILVHKKTFSSFVVIFCFTITILSVFSVDFQLTIRKLFYILHYLLIFLVFTYVIKTEQQIKYCINALVSIAFVISTITILIFMIQFNPSFDIWFLRNWVPLNVTWLLQGWDAANSAIAVNNWIIPLGDRAILRTFFPFINPMALATYLLLIFPVVLSCVIYNPSTCRPFFWKLSLFVISTAIILSFARSVWIGMLLASIVVLLSGKNSLKLILRGFFSLKFPKWFVAIITVITISLVATVSVPATRERMFSVIDMANESNLDRFYTWNLSLLAFKENPILGVGLGIFAEKHYSHNAYLDFAVETGIIGLSLFVLMFFGSLQEAIFIRKRTTSHFLLCTMIGWIAAIIALLVHFFFDNEFFFPQNGVVIIVVLALIRSAYLLTYRNGYACWN